MAKQDKPEEQGERKGEGEQDATFPRRSIHKRMPGRPARRLISPSSPAGEATSPNGRHGDADHPVEQPGSAEIIKFTNGAGYGAGAGPIEEDEMTQASGTPANPAASKFLPDRQVMRRNGTPIPMVVQKIHAALDDGRWERQAVERETRLHPNKFYSWKKVSGEPTKSQTIVLSDYLDISLEYLMDDTIPVQSPHPRRLDAPARRLVEVAKNNGLTVDQVEKYVASVASAVQLGYGPGELLRLLVEISTARSSGKVAPGSLPAATIDAPLVTEAMDADRKDRENRRKGGPKPRTG